MQLFPFLRFLKSEKYGRESFVGSVNEIKQYTQSRALSCKAPRRECSGVRSKHTNMPDPKESLPQPPPTIASRLKQWLVPAIILLLAVGIVVLITTNWNAWAGGRAVEETDDAYLHADLTPLSTKVAGLVATVAVSDYQAVKAGDLLVTLRDDDFTAQVQQAEAAVAAAEAAVVNNQKQKQLQDARIVEAEDGVRTAETYIAAAQAGIEAANAAIAGARGGIDAIQANVTRTAKERKRQEALIATESTTPQRLEQAVADDESYRSQLAVRNADLSTANAQLSSRQADLARAPGSVDERTIRGGSAETPAGSARLAGTPTPCSRGTAKSCSVIGEDQSRLYENRGAGRRDRERTPGQAGTAGEPGDPGNLFGPKRCMGASKLSGKPDSRDPTGRCRGNSS